MAADHCPNPAAIRARACVAGVLSKLLGRTISYRELTFEQDKDAMIRAGVPEQIAEMNAQAFSLTAEGDAEWVT
jgi:hypothetical protein